MQGKNNPVVSIIVPIYNTAMYLPKCIESILNQTFTDFELLLIDDGSTDNSADICRYYATKDSRVLFFQKENGGQGSARNMGLDIAKGEYIAFVDSDDYVEDNMIELLINNLLDYDADISCARIYYHSDKSDFVVESDIIQVNNEGAMKLFVRGEDGLDQAPVAKLYRRTTFEEVRFLHLRGFEDTGTVFKAFLKAEKVVTQNVSVYFYYQRDDSTMHRKFSVRDFDRVVAYKEMEDVISRAGKYTEILPIVTASKIGAIYYVAGEALRSRIPERTEIIKKCQNECKKTLKSQYSISSKNKFLLGLICICPCVFGGLYRMGH